MNSEIKNTFGDHQGWLDNQLESIKDDMGYESQEAFDQDYRTLCPITLADKLSLEKSIYDETVERVKNFANSMKVDVATAEAVMHFYNKLQETQQQMMRKMMNGPTVI